MMCDDRIYITLSIFLIIFLIFINYKVCLCNNNNNINIIEGFRNNNTYGNQNDINTSKYLYVCVDINNNLNQYYVPGDGSMWSNAVKYAETRSIPQPGYIKEIDANSTWAQSGSSNPVAGILCYDNNLNIFSNMPNNPNYNKDDSNSFGGGTNSRQSVINLQPSDITATNFQNNCTKENWYLFREQSGRHYIFAVFKRNPWTNDLTCCTNDSIQRNSCNDIYVDKNGIGCTNYMKTYCNTNDNIKNDLCKSWCNNPTNKPYCKQYKTDYCSTTENIINSYEFCKDWCKSDDAGNMCENNIINYCRNNANDFDLCACMELNNQANLPQELLDDITTKDLKPICWSKRCGERGYITSSMKLLKSTCPTCYQKIFLDKIKARNINLSDINQTCESENKTDTNINITAQSNSQPSDTNPTFQSVLPKSKKKSNKKTNQKNQYCTIL